MNKNVNITMDALEDDDKQKHQETSLKFNAKNYLNVKLGKDEKKKELRIRLLPFDAETPSPFKIVKMHTLKVPSEIAESGWKSYICIEKTPDIDHDKFGNKCPFCELNRQAYNKSKEQGLTEDEKREWTRLSLDNKPKDVCIIRCIERGAEQDGPKFWKFNVRNDNSDPRGLIKGIYYTRKQESLEEEFGDSLNGKTQEQINKMCEESGFVPFNVLDIYNGKDLKVTIEAVYDKDGRRTNKTNISISDYGKVKPISEDEGEVEKWVNDSKKWTDVFAAKDYDYLSIIMNGGIPFYDKANQKWVPKTNNNADSANSQKNNELNEKIEHSIPSDEHNGVNDDFVGEFPF